jgi:AcrR family transcriptional regulator
MARGRPRKIDPDNALKAAMAVFWDKGFDGTSYSDLVEATGMAKPGLYAAFGDKEDLFKKALDHYFYDLGAPRIYRLIDDKGSLHLGLKVFLQEIAASVSGNGFPSGCFFTHSLANMSPDHQKAYEAIQKCKVDRKKALIQLFEKAHERSQLERDADPSALADYLIGQMTAIAIMGRSGASLEEMDAFIEIAMKGFPII